MFYVYILYSPSSDIYYVGSTDDVERRLEEHNHLSENTFTSRHRPWHLKAAFEVGRSRTISLKIEKHIKRQKSREYIEAIIERNSIDRLIAKFSSLG